MMRVRLVLWWMAVIAGSVSALDASAVSTSPSCDTWVAVSDATADGSVILAKNSDRPAMEAQPLVHLSRSRHPLGDRVKCTYIEIPQVEETFEHIGSKIWWAFGYEHGVNEHGVAIGNEAVWSKEPLQWGDGLLGMDLLRLGLERGKTAYEAMHVVVELLEKYGQSGDCEYPGEWGNANYHNSFLIADPKEAWVLETAGRYWVAKRVTSGVYSISNIYSIERDWDEAHPDLVNHAIEMGWSRSAEEFSFARDYGDYWRKDSKDPGAMQIRRNMTMLCLKQDLGKITPHSIMDINRSHLEGTVASPRWGASEPFWASPCMHDSSRSGYHSAASMVAHLRGKMPPLLRQVYWASFSNPCANVFKPFYLNGPKAPEKYGQGTSTYEEGAPWWWAHRVKLLCDLNYRVLSATVRSIFDRTEAWEVQRQVRYEAEAAQLLKEGNPVAAAELIQKFTDENCVRIEKEYRLLNETLPTILQTVGIEFLFLDYLKEWTAKKGVPLPIQ